MKLIDFGLNNDVGQTITRTVVVPIISDYEDNYLLCKMPADRGVFPGQWGLPGGGIEPGESIYEALAREIREELGNIQVENIMPWTFREETRVKTYPNNEQKLIQMIFLIFDCKAKDKNITLNAEFETHTWVSASQFHNYDLNESTIITFTHKGLL